MSGPQPAKKNTREGDTELKSSASGPSSTPSPIEKSALPAVISGQDIRAEHLKDQQRQENKQAATTVVQSQLIAMIENLKAESDQTVAKQIIANSIKADGNALRSISLQESAQELFQSKDITEKQASEFLTRIAGISEFAKMAHQDHLSKDEISDCFQNAVENVALQLTSASAKKLSTSQKTPATGAEAELKTAREAEEPAAPPGADAKRGATTANQQSEAEQLREAIEKLREQNDTREAKLGERERTVAERAEALSGKMSSDQERAPGVVDNVTGKIKEAVSALKEAINQAKAEKVQLTGELAQDIEALSKTLGLNFVVNEKGTIEVANPDQKARLDIQLSRDGKQVAGAEVHVNTRDLDMVQRALNPEAVNIRDALQNFKSRPTTALSSSDVLTSRDIDLKTTYRARDGKVSVNRAGVAIHFRPVRGDRSNTLQNVTVVNEHTGSMATFRIRRPISSREQKNFDRAIAGLSKNPDAALKALRELNPDGTPPHVDKLPLPIEGRVLESLAKLDNALEDARRISGDPRVPLTSGIVMRGNDLTNRNAADVLAGRAGLTLELSNRNPALVNQVEYRVEKGVKYVVLKAEQSQELDSYRKKLGLKPGQVGPFEVKFRLNQELSENEIADKLVAIANTLKADPMGNGVMNSPTLAKLLSDPQLELRELKNFVARGTTLIGLDLRGVKMENGIFDGAVLCESNISNSVLSNVHMINGTQASGLIAKNIIAENGCNFSGTNFTGAEFDRSVLTNTKMKKVLAEGASFAEIQHNAFRSPEGVTSVLYKLPFFGERMKRMAEDVRVNAGGWNGAIVDADAFTGAAREAIVNVLTRISAGERENIQDRFSLKSDSMREALLASGIVHTPGDFLDTSGNDPSQALFKLGDDAALERQGEGVLVQSKDRTGEMLRIQFYGKRSVTLDLVDENGVKIEESTVSKFDRNLTPEEAMSLINAFSNFGKEAMETAMAKHIHELNKRSGKDDDSKLIKALQKRKAAGAS